MTRDRPLVDADLVTERSFGLLVGNWGNAVKDSKESVLEFILSSPESLLAADRSNLKSKNLLKYDWFWLENKERVIKNSLIIRLKKIQV